jgi:hypothetical protein
VVKGTAVNIRRESSSVLEKVEEGEDGDTLEMASVDQPLFPQCGAQDIVRSEKYN